MRKIIFVLVVMGLIIYSVYLFVEPQYNYYAFKSEVEDYMSVAIDKEKDVKAELMRLVEAYDIPVEEDEVYLIRETDSRYRRYSVSISWSETVDIFPFYHIYKKTYEFEVDTTQQ